MFYAGCAEIQRTACMLDRKRTLAPAIYWRKTKNHIFVFRALKTPGGGVFRAALKIITFGNFHHILPVKVWAMVEVEKLTVIEGGIRLRLKHYAIMIVAGQACWIRVTMNYLLLSK